MRAVDAEVEEVRAAGGGEDLLSARGSLARWNEGDSLATEGGHPEQQVATGAARMTLQCDAGADAVAAVQLRTLGKRPPGCAWASASRLAEAFSWQGPEPSLAAWW